MATTTSPTLTFVVTSMERAEVPSAYSLVQAREVFPARAGWDARVDVLADGAVIGTQHFDRIDGEDGWHCSASFRAGCSMPAFMHGLFSRCTVPQLAVPALAALLDAAASPSVDRPVTVGGEGACPAGGGAAHRSYRPGGECTFCGEVVA